MDSARRARLFLRINVSRGGNPSGFPSVASATGVSRPQGPDGLCGLQRRPFRIQWTEEIRTLGGALVRRELWQALVAVASISGWETSTET